MIKATTALNKILGLKKRIKVIQGGQGAGKTYSILMMLIDYASAVEKQDIYIASKELSKMRTTVIKDFKNIMFGFGLFNPHKWNKSTNTYEFKNGSVINFLGLDKEDIGKGLRSDMVFVNEANKVPYETFRESTYIIFCPYSLFDLNLYIFKIRCGVNNNYTVRFGFRQ